MSIQKNSDIHRAEEVADYFLLIQDPADGELITNMKLQKLLYYAQGFTIALMGKPLFTERIIAWDYGPVVFEIWQKYTNRDSNPLPIPDPLEKISFCEEEIDILTEVWNVYGQFSARALKDLTHTEPPWINTPRNSEITHDKLKAFFKTKINE